ncbi:MAG: GAF domain-containing protein [Chloroflexi bacterium]|nr:GAF domain-containing protein [Chloroflexota bacterium]
MDSTASETSPPVPGPDAEARPFAAYDALPARMAVLDGDGRILYANDAWRAFGMLFSDPPHNAGPGADYVDACQSADVLSEVAAREFLAGWRAVRFDRQALFETPYAHSIGGQTVWFLMQVARLNRLDQNLYLVSHARLSTDADARWIDHAGALLDRMPAGLIITSPDFRITHWNRAAERLFGYAAAEAHGRTPYELIMFPEARPRMQRVLSRVQAGGLTVASVEACTAKDGRTLRCEWRITTICDAQGRIQGIFNVVIDVGQRDDMAEHERQAAARRMALAEVGDALAHATLDIDRVLPLVARRTAEMLDATCLLIIFGEHAQDDEIVAMHSVEPSTLKCGIDLTGASLSLADDSLGYQLRSGKPIFMPVVSSAMLKGATPASVHALLDRVDFRSIVGASMRARGDTVGGLLAIRADSVTPFHQADVDLLQGIADRAALAAVTARQHRALELRLHERDAMVQISNALAGTLDLERVLQMIVDYARQLIPHARTGTIHLSNAEGTQLRAAARSADTNRAMTAPVLQPGEGIAGHAFATNQLINAGNANADPRFVRDRAGGVPFALMAAPISSGAGPLGTISISSKMPNAFSPDDERLLARLGGQAALAITNARLYQSEREQRTLAEAMLEIATTINSTLDFDEVIRHVLDSVGRVVPYELAAFFPLENGWLRVQEYRVRANYTLPAASAALRVPVDRWHSMSEAMRTGRPHVVSDTTTDPHWLIAPGVEWTRSNVTVPVTGRSGVIGFLSLSSASPGAYGALHAQRAQMLGDVAAIALANAQMAGDMAQRARQFESLSTIAGELMGAPDLNDLLLTIARSAMELIHAQTCNVHLYDEATDTLELTTGIGSPFPFGSRLRVGEGITGMAARLRHTLRADRYNASPYYDARFASAELAAVMRIPMLYGGRLVGLIAISEYGDSTRTYTDDDERLMMLLAAQAAGAVTNARATRDLQRALEQEQRTRAQLVQADKMSVMGRMVASVAHELSNPLQAILTAQSLAAMDIPPGGPGREYVDIAQNESRRLVELVSRLRTLYRPAAAIRLPIDVAALLDEVEQLLRAHLRDQHVTWHSADAGTALHVVGIADQLRQVFINICLNATDAMQPQGGALTIDSRVSADGQLAGVMFADSGHGIKANDLPHIFEPFFTTKESGMGLGLAICDDIAQKHGGHIDVRSAPGEGATFTVWLPLAAGSADGETVPVG